MAKTSMISNTSSYAANQTVVIETFNGQAIAKIAAVHHNRYSVQQWKRDHWSKLYRLPDYRVLRLATAIELLTLKVSE